MLDIAWLMLGIANVHGHLAGEHFTSGFVTQMSLVVSMGNKYEHWDCGFLIAENLIGHSNKDTVGYTLTLKFCQNPNFKTAAFERQMSSD